MFDAIKTNNSFTSIASINAELIGQASSSRPSAMAAWKRRFFKKKNITRTLQVLVATLNEKSSEDSSSNEVSADKSDEEGIQELAEEEIQESVEDVQESVRGDVQEATKEAPGDEAVTLS